MESGQTKIVEDVVAQGHLDRRVSGHAPEPGRRTGGDRCIELWYRVAISNSRLVSADHKGVTFTFKDYRLSGPDRYKTITLEAGEFIRRFLLHVLPKGFHRIRHYGLLANGQRAEKLDLARALLGQRKHDKATPAPQSPDETHEPGSQPHPCPKCGGPMVIIETFAPGECPRRPQARDPPEAKAA